MKILKCQHGLNLLTPDKAVQIAKQKLDQWYNDPTTLHMIYWSDPARNELTVNVRKKQHGWKDVTDSKGRPVTKTFSSPHEKYQWEVEQGLNSKYLYQKPESEKYPNATGMYHPRTGVVEISPESKHPQYTAIHEYDHAIQDRLPSINKPIRKVEHKLRSGYKPNEYLDKPEEIRSRIMQARVYLNLDPKKRNYTKEDADKMQQQLSTSKISSLQQLYRLDPETMAGYLNYLAEADEYTDAPIEIPQNNTYDDLNDNVLHASKGGSIHIKKKNRGKFTESAKRAGMGVQEYARHVLTNKDKYSSTLVKRANFARNAKKFKHENGGVLKAQEGTGNLYNPQPLSPLDIALKTAGANAKLKENKPKLPPGVKEVVGPDGKKVAIRTEQPLVPLEQNIAEWLPGTGDVAEAGYIANDVKNGRYGSAALATAMIALPGNVGKILRKGDTPPVSKLTWEEKLGIPKGERNQPAKPRSTRAIEYDITPEGLPTKEFLDDFETYKKALSGEGREVDITDMFDSSWYRERLAKQGLTEEQVNQLISRLKARTGPDQIMVADGLNYVRDFSHAKEGIPIGMTTERTTQLGRHSTHPSFNGKSLIQLTTKVDPEDVILHEIGGHRSQSLVSDFAHLYDGQKMTDLGIKHYLKVGAPSDYGVQWDEVRARALAIAKQMSDAGWNPNSPEQVNVWLNKHILTNNPTNVNQGALYYDRPSFIKAVSEGLKKGGKLPQ